MKNIKLNGSLISLSENQEDSTKIVAKFLICPLDVLNANKAGLREKDLTDEEKVGLIGEPLVCKVIKDTDGNYNFSGHNMKKIKEIDSEGKLVTRTDFDTQAIGYHTDMQIEEIEINGVVKRCFVATANIWKRYYRAVEVIQRLGDSLRTSWEIGYNSYYIEKGGKWLKEITWIGNCALGSNVRPAYGDAGLLEVAEEDDDMQLAIAFTEDLKDSNVENSTEDIKENKEEGGQDMADDKEIVVEPVTEPVVEETTTEKVKEEPTVEEVTKKQDEEKSVVEEVPTEEPHQDEVAEPETSKETETSAMTMQDLYEKVRKAINDYDDEYYYYIVRLYPYDLKAIVTNDWNSDEDDMVEFTYVVTDDNDIEITAKRDVKMVFVAKDLYESQATELSEKIDNIVKLGEVIQEKDTIIAEKETIIQEKDVVISEKDVLISELEPFKAQVQEIEKAQKEAELAEAKQKLKDKYISSKYIKEEDFETSEVLKEAIDNLDEKAIKVVIAERVMEIAQSKVKSVEISETKTEIKQDINSQVEYEYANQNPILAWLGKNKK